MLAKLESCKVVPVCAVQSVDQGLRMAEALTDAGLPIAEITFRTDAAEATIKDISERFPDMLVGAGTILNVADLQRAIEAGAKFAVAPGTNPRVVKAALTANFAFYPGVATPTDVECAMDLGCSILKFFPAGAAGGTAMLKALCGPYGHTGIQFVPTGGISASNMMEYLAIPQVLAIGGSWMVAGKLMNDNQWDTVKSLAAEAVKLANQD